MTPERAARILQAIHDLAQKKALNQNSQTWCPQRPHPKQQEFLSLQCLEALYGGAAGGGKALHIDTPIPTPQGWTTMGNIKPGDLVFAGDGSVTRVMARSKVMRNRPCYEMEFSDGSTFVADAKHLWLTWSTAEREHKLKSADDKRAHRRKNRLLMGKGKRPDVAARNTLNARIIRTPSPSLRTTEEIALTLRVRVFRINHAVDVAPPINMPTAHLPLDPYLLGIWLGDGTSSAGAITTADEEIIQAFEDGGMRVFYRTRYLYRVEGLHGILRENGLLNNKHIPPAYLRASAKQRLSLLQGLMDTDGYSTQQGSSEFVTTKKEIRDGMAELLSSLGIKARAREGRATLNGVDHGPKWTFKVVSHLPLFRLKRKMDRQKTNGFRGTHDKRYITRCDPISPQPVRCIQVEHPSGMFLAGRQMVPTHNSSTLLMGALTYMDVPNYSALILRRTYADLALPGAIMDRAGEWLRPTAARWRDKDKQWVFPSGARLTFGYLEHENDKYRYQGSEHHYIGFDELTQFSETQYTYLLSRLRRLRGSNIPIRARAASNPGGMGHDWVYRRFVDPASHADRVFVPALLDDNPSIDRAEYLKSLDCLDELTRRQLRDGEWVRSAHGRIYPIERDLNLIPSLAPGPWRYLLAVDLGSSLVRPTTGFVVNAYGDHAPVNVAVESRLRSMGSPGDVAEETRRLMQNYDFDTMVMDEGGLGSGYIREMQDRYHLPFEQAQNRNKRGYRKLMRGDIERGLYKIVEPANGDLIEEMGRLQFNEAGTDAEKGATDHITDAALYAYIHCYHYLHRPDTGPKRGTPEAIEADAERMLLGHDGEEEDDDDDPAGDVPMRLRGRLG